MIRARKIGVATCEHGTVFVQLANKRGETVAQGGMESSVARQLAADILAACDEVDAGRGGNCGRLH